MKTSTSTATLLLLLSLLSISFSCHAFLEEACKSVATFSPGAVTYDFCVTSLQAAPGSRSTNHVGLSLIAVNLASANDTYTKSKISDLLKTASDRKVIGLLNDCLGHYSDAASLLKKSMNAIKSGRYGDAKTWLSAAMNGPSACEGGFEGIGGKSPLTKENNDLDRLILIALILVG